MPTTYTCDQCPEMANSLDNWYTVAIAFFSEGPGAPPPGSRTFDGAAPTLIFHDIECRNAWCEQAGIAPPEATNGSAEPTGA